MQREFVNDWEWILCEWGVGKLRMEKLTAFKRPTVVGGITWSGV